MKISFNIAFLFLFALISNNAPSQDYIIVNKILIQGNKKTKDYIIRRELSFSELDTIAIAKISDKFTESSNNLINTSLFHFANIFILDSNSGPYVDIQINLTERWYLWPVPVADIDERNFNSWLESKRLSRLSAGANLSYLNSRGRMEQFHLSFLAGYNTVFGIEYDFPYLNPKKTIGIKVLAKHIRNHETKVETTSNKINYLKIESTNAIEESVFGVGLKFRPNLYFSNEFTVAYEFFKINDTIFSINPDFAVNKASKLHFFYLYNKLKIDKRDYKSYPLKGYYADIEFFKYGLGILNNAPDFFSLKTTLRKYFKISNKFYYAAGAVLKISDNNSQAYLLQKGLGYGRDFVRGYEYYVIDASSFFYFKSNLKYTVIPENIYEVPFIKTEKFNTIPYSLHANLFLDFGKTKAHKYNSETNFLDNEFLYGVGVGLDLVTYYDRVARFEFTINKEGESGLYLHFIAPI